MAPSSPSPSPSALRENSFLRGFLRLGALGIAGILALIPVLPPLLESCMARAQAMMPRGAPPLPHIPISLLVGLSLIQPTIFVLGAVAVGLLLAPQLGLRSYIVGNVEEGAPRFSKQAIAAVGLAILVGSFVLLLDHFFRPHLSEALYKSEAQAGGYTVMTFIAGMLYGGAVEELMMRWGVVSFIAWAAGRIFQGPGHLPSAKVMWSAVLIAAILFGAGHLPAAQMITSLTPMLVFRTVLLNAICGVAYGWLYWRFSLEAAMLSHASTHVVFAILNLLGLAT